MKFTFNFLFVLVALVTLARCAGNANANPPVVPPVNPQLVCSLSYEDKNVMYYEADQCPENQVMIGFLHSDGAVGCVVPVISCGSPVQK